MKKNLLALLIFTTMGLMTSHCGEESVLENFFKPHIQEQECKSREKKIIPFSKQEELVQISQNNFPLGEIPDFAGFIAEKTVFYIKEFSARKNYVSLFIKHWNKIQMRT